MNPSIRAIHRAELPQVYDLLAFVFAEKEGSPLRFVAQTESDSTFRLRHGRVAVLDGRVVAYVRIFARTMLIRGAPVPVGGIGSVATHPDVRSSGIATALLRNAIMEMQRAEMASSFLFTGIPGFYERVGYRVVREPSFSAEAAEVAELDSAGPWDVREMSPVDLPSMLNIYRRAIGTSTGAIIRTASTWRDATTWLDEDEHGCFVAERDHIVVAYLRSRRRGHRQLVLEAECASGHEGAIAALLSAVGRRAMEHGERIVALIPDDHPLATVLRSLPSTVETLDVEHPMMVLVLDARGQGLLSEPIRWWNTDRI